MPSPPSPGVAGTPPFILPGEHFGAALLFLLAGVVGIVFVAPELAAGSHPSTRIIGVTHLFTLGWITTSIMGALYQFVPVALGVPIRSERLGHVAFAMYAPGVAAFVGGLVFASSGLMLGGAATLGAGVMVFASNLGATLHASERRDVTWWALACADVFLVVTLAFGLTLTGNLHWGYLGGARFVAVGTHLHIALAGWVLLVMVGVAHRLLPMFLLSHGAGDRFARAAVTLIAAGVAMLAAFHRGPYLAARWLPAALIGSGLLCFLAQARAFYRHRHRPVLDPGMRLAAGALALIGLGLVLAGPALTVGMPSRVATAYVLAIILGVSAFVAAHYFKIVPFLVWYHRFGPLAGKQPVPRVGELFSSRAASVAGGLWVSGVLALTLLVLFGAPGAARGAALVLCAGACIEATQMVDLARRKP